MDPQPFAYEDAVDFLDADHKAVKKMFIDYDAAVEDKAPAATRLALAHEICAALAVHARIEEEIFYPAVREAIGDDALVQHAVEEHAQAKALIARLESMGSSDKALDPTVKQLAKLIDQHVLEEREQMFLQARAAALDLRALALPLAARKLQLQQPAAAPAKEAA